MHVLFKFLLNQILWDFAANFRIYKDLNFDNDSVNLLAQRMPYQCDFQFWSANDRVGIVNRHDYRYWPQQKPVWVTDQFLHSPWTPQELQCFRRTRQMQDLWSLFLRQKYKQWRSPQMLRDDFLPALQRKSRPKKLVFLVPFFNSIHKLNIPNKSNFQALPTSTCPSLFTITSSLRRYSSKMFCLISAVMSSKALDKSQCT